jgi:RimJ/RimL family protein N-acetyltransferase
VVTNVLTTDRLTLRPWRIDDAEAALRVFGDTEVARWLSPALERVSDVGAMRLLLQQWSLDDARTPAPTGRWAVQLSDARVVGGVSLLYLPPGGEDLEIGVQLAPDAWGQGFATEAGHRVAHHAFTHDGVDELFAVVRPTNTRAATMATRIGMEWVGETSKYYDLRLHVYRLRSADLDKPLPGQPDAHTTENDDAPGRPSVRATTGSRGRDRLGPGAR